MKEKKKTIGSEKITNMVDDPRFSSMHTAPIFKKNRKENHKVTLDPRFHGVLTDNRFRVAPGKIDKYGRNKTKSHSSGNKNAADELSEFYEIENNDNDDDNNENGHDEDTGEGEVGILTQPANLSKSNNPNIKLSKSILKDKARRKTATTTTKKSTSQTTTTTTTPMSTRLEYLTRLARGEISDDDSDESSSEEEEEDLDDDSSRHRYGNIATTKRRHGSDESSSSDEDEDEDDEEEEEDDDTPSSSTKKKVAGPLTIPEEEEEEEVSKAEVDDTTLVMESTHRLAVLHCEWNHMKAEDIMVILQSFCPSGDTVKSVTVYLSDFGKKRLAEESLTGPQGIWRPNNNNDDDDDDDENSNNSISDSRRRKLGNTQYKNSNTYESEEEEEEEEDYSSGEDNDNEEDDDEDDDNNNNDVLITRSVSNKKSKEKDFGDFKRSHGKDHIGIVMQDDLEDDEVDEEGEEVDDNDNDDDSESLQPPPSNHGSSNISTSRKRRAKPGGGGVDDVALRKYELSKLRYYFAVAELSSVRAAERLYTELDGVELEHSAMVFDLRFIPDDTSFEDREIRDVCHVSPPQQLYKPPDFIVNALQHTNVQCSWEEDDPARKKLLQGSGSTSSQWRDLAESDLQTYLAAPSSGSEDDGEDTKKPMNSQRSSKSSQLRKLLLGEDAEEDDDEEEEDINDTGMDLEEDSFFLHDEEESSQSQSNSSSTKKKQSIKKGERDGEAVFTYIPEQDNHHPNSYKDLSLETPQEAAQRKKLEKLQNKKQKQNITKLNSNNKNLNQGYHQASEEEEGAEAEERKRVDLELLFAGEDEAEETRNYDMLQVVKQYREAKKAGGGGGGGSTAGNTTTTSQSKNDKKKKGKSKKSDNVNTTIDMEAVGLPSTTSAATDTFSLNLNDQRFDSLLSGDPKFGIDPLSSEYKETNAMSTILKEQRKRRRLQEQQQQQQEEEGNGGGNIPPNNLSYTSKDNRITNQGNDKVSLSNVHHTEEDGDDGDDGMSHLVKKLKNKFGDKNNSNNNKGVTLPESNDSVKPLNNDKRKNVKSLQGKKKSSNIG